MPVARVQQTPPPPPILSCENFSKIRNFGVNRKTAVRKRYS